jgi:hypothetical protein
MDIALNLENVSCQYITVIIFFVISIICLYLRYICLSYTNNNVFFYNYNYEDSIDDYHEVYLNEDIINH